MKRFRRIDPADAKVIKQTISERGIIDVEEAMDIVRPKFLFDTRSAFEADLRRKTHQILASLRDERGIRRCFATDDGRFVNLDVSRDISAVDMARTQLEKKTDGLMSSKLKADRRYAELAAQQSQTLE